MTFRIGQLVDLAAGYWIDRDGSFGAKMIGGSYESTHRGEVVGVGTSPDSVVIHWRQLDVTKAYALARCGRVFLSVSAVDDLANVLEDRA